MLPKFLMPELIVCIILSVAYFVYIGVKYRKTPNFGSSILWGLGSFLVTNAIANVVLMVIVQVIGEESIRAMTAGDPRILLIDATARTTGIVFTAFFILKQIKRNKTKIDSQERIELIGLVAGGSSIFSPINMGSALLMYIQGIMNIIVINKNPTQQELGDVSLENLLKTKEALMNTAMFDYLSVALVSIVTAYAIMMVFKCADAYFNEENRIKKFGIPSITYFGFLMVIAAITSLFSSSIVRVILIIVLGIAIVLIDKLVLPKLSIFIARKESYNKTIMIDVKPTKKNKK